MTQRTNARLAGSMFLLYIVTGIVSMALFGQASQGEGAAARLASIAQNAPTVRFTVVLTLATFVYAVGLGVTLQALTRDQDPELAMFAMCCRVAEGVIGAVAAVRTLGLVALAKAAAGGGPDAAAAQSLGALQLSQGGWSGSIGAACFAIGSTVFCYLFLRARSIPAWLAWLGVFASLLLVAAIPAQIVGFLKGIAAWLIWMPMLAFEVVLAGWLIVRAIPAPTHGSRTGPPPRAGDPST